MNDERLEQLYREYRDLVINTANRVLKDYHLAEDVCQEVFVKMSTKTINRLYEADNRTAYMKAVACRRAIDYGRFLKIRQADGDVDFALIPDEDLETDYLIKETCQEMLEGLRKKNELWYQVVLRLGFYDDVPELTARDLGISLNLLRSKYHRAKRWARKNFEEEYLLLHEVLDF